MDNSVLEEPAGIGTSQAGEEERIWHDWKWKEVRGWQEHNEVGVGNEVGKVVKSCIMQGFAGTWETVY